MGCDQVAVSLGDHFFLATGCRMRFEERVFLLEKLKQVGIVGSITFRQFSRVETSSKRAISFWSWYYAFVDMLRRNSVSVEVALASRLHGSGQFPRVFTPLRQLLFLSSPVARLLNPSTFPRS